MRVALFSDTFLCPSIETMEFLDIHAIQNTSIFSRGVDSEKFSPDFRNEKLRKKLGIDDSSLRKKLSLNSRKTGLQRSWKCIVEELLVTYQDVIYSKQRNCKRIV